MEFVNIPPRADPSAVTTAATQNPAPDALSTRAETARPVLAAAKTNTARGAGEEDFQPLDTFKVGDNDHAPVPPEPPREATVLAVMASASEAEPPPDPAPAQDALATTLRDIDDGPENPTVDIRR